MALSFRPDLLFRFEIQVIMIFTTGVEGRGAFRAGVVALHVLIDGEFVTAYATEDAFCIKFFFGPYGGRMVCSFFMAGEAWIVLVAAVEFDGNDIQRGVPVNTPRLIIHGLAVNGNTLYLSLALRNGRRLCLEAPNT